MRPAIDKRLIESLAERALLCDIEQFLRTRQAADMGGENLVRHLVLPIGKMRLASRHPDFCYAGKLSGET